MKNALINYAKNIKDDEFHTPEYAITPILAYLKKFEIFWECCDRGGSNITKLLQKENKIVKTSHILNGEDFLSMPEFDCDCIITNPPYSLKTQFIKKAFELNKPFAMLLPLTALEGIERGAFYRKYGIELMIFDKRINFTEKRGVWFATAWFCWKILPEKLIFHELRNWSK